MRTIKFVITTSLFLLSISLFAANAIPIVNLPPKPTKAKLNQLLKSPDLYVNTLLDYYYAAVCYEAQLQTMGIPLTRTLTAPTAQQLSKPVLAAIKQQWTQAAALHKQVKAVDILNTNQKDVALNENVFRLSNELARLRADSASQALQVKELELFRTLFVEASQATDELKKQHTETTMPLLGVGAGASILISNDAAIDASLGTALSLYINPSKILGVKNSSPIWIDCWLDYAASSFTTETNIPTASSQTQTMHSADILSAGASVALHLSQLFGRSTFKWTLRPGIGYYWLNDETPNTANPNVSWRGLNLKIETEFVFWGGITPVGLFASYSALHTASGLTLNGYTNSVGTSNFGNRWMGKATAGLRFYLINNSF